MMLYLTTIITFSFLLCRGSTATTSLDGGWSGNMSYSYFPTSSDCSGAEPLYFGYETYVKAMEYGTFCVTDNQGGIDMYGKWIIQCVPTTVESTIEGETTVPNAVYEFFQSCNDVDCQDCSEIPISAIQVPWTNFEKGPPRCMVTRAFNATTTNPVEEFATYSTSTENFESLLAPPTSESFGKMGESSQEELNEYWQYYFDNSCLGMMDVASSTITSLSSSAYVARGNYMFQLGVLFLSLQAYSMLVEYV